MKKILVIEDDLAILEAIQLTLESENYTVHATPKANQAISVISEFKPDLILLDLLLSGENGQDIVKRIKTIPLFQSIPIIMLSAHPQAREIVKNCGADEFIAKPFDIDELLNTVNRILNGDRKPRNF